MHFCVVIDDRMTEHFPRFNVRFWLSLILIYIFYLCPSLPKLGCNKINKQGYGLARKGHGNAVIDAVCSAPVTAVGPYIREASKMFSCVLNF